jgi:hypothetical protein
MSHPENLYFGTQKAYRLGIKPDDEKVRIYEAYAFTTANKNGIINFAMVYRYTVWPAEYKFRVREVQVVFINNDDSKLSSAEEEIMIVKYIDSEAKRHNDTKFMSEVRDKIESSVNEGTKTNIIGDYLGVDLPVMDEYLINKNLADTNYIAIEIVPDTVNEYHTIRHNDVTTINEKFVKLGENLERWLPLLREGKNANDDNNNDKESGWSEKNGIVTHHVESKVLRNAITAHLHSIDAKRKIELSITLKTVVRRNKDGTYISTHGLIVRNAADANDIGINYLFMLEIDSVTKITKLVASHLIMPVPIDGHYMSGSELIAACYRFFEENIKRTNWINGLKEYGKEMQIDAMMSDVTGVTIPSFEEFVYPKIVKLFEYINNPGNNPEKFGVIKLIVDRVGYYSLLITEKTIDKESNNDTPKILHATCKAPLRRIQGRFTHQTHTVNNKHMKTGMSSKLRRATGGSEKELRFNSRTAVMKDGDIFMVTFVITIYDKNKENDLGATYIYCILIDSKKKTTKIDCVHYVAIIAANGVNVDNSVLLQTRDSFIQNTIANANVEYKLSQYNDLSVEEMLKKITGVDVPSFTEFIYLHIPTLTELIDELKNGDVDEQVRGIIRVTVHSDGAFIDHLLISDHKSDANKNTYRNQLRDSQLKRILRHIGKLNPL